MKTLRAVVSEPMSARSNVCLTAAMMELHLAGRIPDTLRLYTYPRSVLLGRGQKLSQEVNEQECEAKGVEIARRITGGGAIYMDRGVATWDLIAGARHFSSDPANARRQIAEAVAAAFLGLGLPVALCGDTGIELAGRKVCGMSGTIDGPTLVCQGSILVDADVTQMWRTLKRSQAVPFGAFSGTVANLSMFLEQKSDVPEVHRLIAASIAAKLDRAVEYNELSGAERELAVHLFHEFGSDSFVHDVESDVTSSLKPNLEAAGIVA